MKITRDDIKEMVVKTLSLITEASFNKDWLTFFNDNPDVEHSKANFVPYFATKPQQKSFIEQKKNYELYLGIYEAMEAHGMAEDGQKYLNMALEIKGDGGNDLLQKGCIYYYLGEKDKAIELLEDALEKKVYEANFYLAEIYTESGEVERAETYFAAYLESGIADSTSLCKMGENQMACGNYSQAITYFLAALEMEEVPNKQAIMKNVVVSYEELGEFASARAMLEDYVELFPDDEAAARELIFLQTR